LRERVPAVDQGAYEVQSDLPFADGFDGAES
jgi:hypothetical protein